MTVFIVCRVTYPDKMKFAAESNFPDNHLAIGHGEWLISTKGSAREVSDKLEVTNVAAGTPSIAGSAIIFSVENYYGRASNDIWEWNKIKSEAVDG